MTTERLKIVDATVCRAPKVSAEVRKALTDTSATTPRTRHRRGFPRRRRHEPRAIRATRLATSSTAASVIAPQSRLRSQSQLSEQKRAHCPTSARIDAIATTPGDAIRPTLRRVHDSAGATSTRIASATGKRITTTAAMASAMRALAWKVVTMM